MNVTISGPDASGYVLEVYALVCAARDLYMDCKYSGADEIPRWLADRVKMLERPARLLTEDDDMEGWGDGRPGPVKP